MVPERSFRRCRAKRGIGVGNLLTSPAHPADTPSGRLCRGFPDHVALRSRPAFRTDPVFAIDDHEVGKPLACRAKCRDNRVHFSLQAVSNESRRHDYGRNGTDWAELARAMFSNFETDDL